MNGNYQTRPAFYSGSSQAKELYKYVLSETKAAANGGTRFVVRAVQFEDNKSPYVVLSRQWFKWDTNEWLPTKSGHIFLPIIAWTSLVANIGQINTEVVHAVSDGSDGRRGDSERADVSDASRRDIPDDTDFYCGGGAAGFGNGDGASCSTAGVDEPCGKTARKAKAKANAYAGNITHTAYSDEQSRKRHKLEH